MSFDQSFQVPISDDLFGDDGDDTPDDNPFAPRREARPAIGADQPRKLQLLGRGLAVFGTYAKVLEVDGRAVAYVQFGPLSAYPRAQRLRELYPRLPSAPLPAYLDQVERDAILAALPSVELERLHLREDIRRESLDSIKPVAQPH